MKLATDYPFVEAYLRWRAKLVPRCAAEELSKIPAALKCARDTNAPADALWGPYKDGSWAVMRGELSDKSQLAGLTAEEMASGKINPRYRAKGAA